MHSPSRVSLGFLHPVRAPHGTVILPQGSCATRSADNQHCGCRRRNGNSCRGGSSFSHDLSFPEEIALHSPHAIVNQSAVWSDTQACILA